jgi:hypothetical protein
MMVRTIWRETLFTIFSTEEGMKLEFFHKQVSRAYFSFLTTDIKKLIIAACIVLTSTHINPSLALSQYFCTSSKTVFV